MLWNLNRNIDNLLYRKYNLHSKGNKIVLGKVATTRTEDGHK